MDERYINEEVLTAAAKALFGEYQADTLMRVYNAMQSIAADAWFDGYDMAEDDFNLKVTGVPVDAFREEVEQDMADEAQLTMDALWGDAAEQAFDEPPRIHSHPEGSAAVASITYNLRAREAAFNDG